jgi:integrase
MVKHQFAANGKRDIHHLENGFDNSFERLESSEKWIYDSNRTIVIEYLKACKKGQAKSGGRNIRVGKAALYRVLGILRILSEKWIKKDFDSATPQDWQQFYDKMEENEFLNNLGKKFKQATKAKNYKTIRKFLKFRYGNNRAYPDICADWVTTEEKTTKEYLTRQEVEKMIQAANTTKIKCMIMMLFDGGFRIEELANLKWSDVIKDEGKSYFRADVRAETSKTKKARRVSLWLATDLIESYKNSLISVKKFNPSEFLFEANYDVLNQTVRRLGDRILNKKISPHTLRHSSATYYASVIKTYQQFCARYGWTLRSNAPQVYFHAVADDEIAEQTKDHEIARFKTEFERQRLQNQRLQEALEKMKRDQDSMRDELFKDIVKELGITK